MRAAVAAMLSLSLCLASAEASAQQLQQSVKYKLLVVASGMNDGESRDGVTMSGSGIYMGREQCEAAGAGIRYGVVNQRDNQPPPTITWVCVPLGKP